MLLKCGLCVIQSNWKWRHSAATSIPQWSHCDSLRLRRRCGMWDTRLLSLSSDLYSQIPPSHIHLQWQLPHVLTPHATWLQLQQVIWPEHHGLTKQRQHSLLFVTAAWHGDVAVDTKSADKLLTDAAHVAGKVHRLNSHNCSSARRRRCSSKYVWNSVKSYPLWEPDDSFFLYT